jgi:multiple sugar transport system permease protein
VHCSAAEEERARGHRSLARQALLYMGAVAILIWSGDPFAWQLSTSFQLDKALSAATPTFIPYPFTLQHYCDALFNGI